MFRVICIFACVAFFIVLAVVCSGEAFGLPQPKVPTMAPTVTPEEIYTQTNLINTNAFISATTKWFHTEAKTVQFLRRGNHM